MALKQEKQKACASGFFCGRHKSPHKFGYAINLLVNSPSRRGELVKLESFPASWLLNMSRLILTLPLLIAFETSLAGAPYLIETRAQPAGIAANTFLGYALAAGDRGVGLAGALNGTVQVIAPNPGGNIVFAQTLSSGINADLFGASVAVASPQVLGSFAAVGAFGDDVPSLNSGKVYAYRTQASLLMPFAEAGVLSPPIPSATGNFGYSVAAEGNFIYVGEVKAQNPGGDVVGAVHVFENTGATTWALRTSIYGTQLDGVQGRRFGHAVAVSGNTLAIGAPKENEGAFTTAGAVYVYTGAGASWTQQARLTAGDLGSDDELGSAVDIDGDTIVAGGSRDDKVVGNDAGSAYIFARNAGTWSQSAKLLSSGATTGNLFGTAVSISGNEALVGAYCEPNGANACTGPGSVEAFQRGVNGNWIAVQRIVAADGVNGEGFGSSVAHAGPTNRFAYVGAFRASTPALAGAVYLLRGDQLFADGFE